MPQRWAHGWRRFGLSSWHHQAHNRLDSLGHGTRCTALAPGSTCPTGAWCHPRPEAREFGKQNTRSTQSKFVMTSQTSYLGHCNIRQLPSPAQARRRGRPIVPPATKLSSILARTGELDSKQLDKGHKQWPTLFSRRGWRRVRNGQGSSNYSCRMPLSRTPSISRAVHK